MIIEERRTALADPAATMQLGARLVRGMRGGMVFTLTGDLGTGKTTLVRGMLRALGWTGSVKSPTYTLVEHYLFSSLYFYHFDFYRLQDSSEWETGGFSEYFRADAICVIEWPERVSQFLPSVDLAIALDYADAGRKVRLLASSVAGSACLAGIPSHG